MKTPPSRNALLAALLLWSATFVPVQGHVPVPDGVLDPRTAPEAWNVLRLATTNAERLLHENRLAEVPDQVSLCSPALRALPGFAATPARQTAAKAAAVRAAVTINSLAQGALAGDRPLAAQSLSTLQANLRDLAASFDPATVRADIFVCPMHPDFASPDPDARCEKCGMPLIPRRIPYSFVYTAPGEPTLRLTAQSPPLQPGRPARVTIHLAHADGSPVLLPELLVVHTQPIHLLIVDANLRDYHHEHPTPTETPGDYVCSFTPTESCRYRLFADLVPADTGVQEYPFTDLPGTSPSVQNGGEADHGDRTPTSDATASGLRFHLDWPVADPAPPRANQPQTLRITVAAPDGQPMTRLEPVMAAYAHLVGFYEDGRTVVHLHPAGRETLDPGARGGPTLDFKFYPPRSGFLRLYCQVQVNGQQVFAPFNVNIAP